MKNDILEIFYQDYDGEMVLSEVVNFENEKDFLEGAQQYVNATTGYHVPIIETNVEIINIVVNNEGEWHGENVAKEESFEGRKLSVYRVDVDWENAET